MSTPSLIDVLETAYRLELSDEEWLNVLMRVARPYLGGDVGVVGYIFDSEQSPIIHPDEIAFVLAYVALGYSDKFIAYELGITRSTVSNHIVAIRRKLGLRSRVELIRLAQTLGPTPDAPPSNVARWLHRFELHGESLASLGTKLSHESSAALSKAEREIFIYISEGLSNAQIAAKRGTSLRTVANQVATIFVKLGVNSRAELMALTS